MTKKLTKQTLMDEICKHLKNGNWSIGRHAIGRMRERNISLPEIEYVLRYGSHNAKKDTKSDTGLWKYNVDGLTKDDKNIRVCVLFEGDMFIVTVIDLDL